MAHSPLFSGMATILIVDDDFILNGLIEKHLKRAGHQTEPALTVAQGLALARSGNFDLILLDVQLPDGNSLDFFSAFSEVASAPEIIIMTGSGDPDGAKKAIQFGAWGYLEKPHAVRDLLLPVTRALQFRAEKKKIGVLPVALKREAIIGSSASLTGCLDFVAKAAIGDASVLLTGETGTGKEVFARAIHDNSPRASHPFVVVDCAALPENLIESTLFGHVKGSFTGAERTTSGLVKMAHGGTLFLDEVGEMPLRIQKTFLRVLQEHRFRPVGDSKEEYSNFRLIAATNRDLDSAVDNGAFRADLLFRLRSLALHLPPLRERKQDIRELTLHFLKRLCVLHKVSSKGIDDELIEYLLAHDWPGNVRELQQTIEQVFVNALHYPTLYAFHLPEHFRVRKTLASMTMAPAAAPHATDIDSRPLAGPPPSWKDHKTASECRYLKHLLAFTRGDVREACRVSGLSRSRLYQLINQYNLTSPERSSP